MYKREHPVHVCIVLASGGMARALDDLPDRQILMTCEEMSVTPFILFNLLKKAF